MFKEFSKEIQFLIVNGFDRGVRVGNVLFDSCYMDTSQLQQLTDHVLSYLVLSILVTNFAVSEISSHARTNLL